MRGGADGCAGAGSNIGGAAGGTADGFPADIPYGTPINLETAKKLVAAVEAESVKHRWKMVITVVDTNGDGEVSIEPIH